MAVWKGVPLQSAIIVRHTPRDYAKKLGRKDTGAMPCASNARAVAYISRTGAFESKSDIDREPTPQDRQLSAERDAADRLDYAAREGAYEGKGAALQEDASLWDANGPVSVGEARARMRADGGAFIDSVVSIKREYAAALQLESKEDMQRLLRATWSENVEKWGLVKDPADIRWVAAYHTDASESLHCHVLTWSARGEIEQGSTVGREATRAGKEAIYCIGYARIREERDARSNFLRDLARQQIRVIAGERPDARAAAALDARARKAGWPERSLRESDVPPQDRAPVEAARARVASELAAGSGAVARNWKAQAAARDLVAAARRASPSFSRTCAERELTSEVKADVRGMAEGSAERKASLRADAEDFAKRTASAAVRACMPEDARERAREGRQAWDRARGEGGKRAYAQSQAAARDRRRRAQDAERARLAAQARLSRPDLVRQQAAARRYGISLEQASKMGRELAQLSRAVEKGTTWDEASPRAKAAARAFASEALKTPAAARAVQREAERQLAARPGGDPGAARSSAERACAERMARALVDAAGRGVLSDPPSKQPRERAEDRDRSGGGLGLAAGMLDAALKAALSPTAKAGGQGIRRRPRRRAPEREMQRAHIGQERL